MSQSSKKYISISFVANAVYNTNRLFKLSKFIVEKTKVDKVNILGFWESNLKKNEKYHENIEIIRIKSFHQFFQVKSIYFKKFLIVLSIFPLYVSFIIKAIKRKPKYIFCHDVFFLPASLVVKLFCASHLFYMPHELETEEDGISNIQKRFFQLFERVSFPFIKHTIVVSDDILRWYSNKYKIDNISVIKNIPDFHYDFNQPKLLRTTLNISSNAIVFIYQGLIDVSRGINTLIECFLNLKDQNKHLVVMGYGPATKLVCEASLVNTNIHYLNAVPAEKIFSYTSDADIGISFIPGNELTLSYKYSLSNKLFEYLKCRVPIVCSDNLVSISNVIISNNCGWVLKSSTEHFSEFVLNVKKNELEKLSPSLSKAAVNFNWEDEVLIIKSKIDDCYN